MGGLGARQPKRAGRIRPGFESLKKIWLNLGESKKKNLVEIWPGYTPDSFESLKRKNLVEFWSGLGGWGGGVRGGGGGSGVQRLS